MIASGVAGLSYVDSTAPIGTQVYYIVRAETDETCSTGPNNGGLVDENTVEVAVSDTDSQPVSGAVVDLAVDLINDVHIRLVWSAPADAYEYNVYRSTEPSQGFLLLGETMETMWDDETVGANANSYYYTVRAANACGQETP